MTLLYDSTFEGFLCCVFASYELQLVEVDIQKEEFSQVGLFSDSIIIKTDISKSERLWASLKKKTSRGTSNTIYYAYLSEKTGVENVLFRYIQYIFDNKLKVDKDYSNENVLKTSQIAKMVGREKHRMEAFIRFRLTRDNIYFAVIEPDFNVLPIILKHFKSRYADQKWLIYDIKRKFGIYYDLDTVQSIKLDFKAGSDPRRTTEIDFSDNEMDFQKLWFDYFKSTNIESRKNMKLHIRHVPKRYWKYLSEKRPY